MSCSSETEAHETIDRQLPFDQITLQFFPTQYNYFNETNQTCSSYVAAELRSRDKVAESGFRRR